MFGPPIRNVPCPLSEQQLAFSALEEKVRVLQDQVKCSAKRHVLQYVETSGAETASGSSKTARHKFRCESCQVTYWQHENDLSCEEVSMVPEYSLPRPRPEHQEVEADKASLVQRVREAIDAIEGRPHCDIFLGLRILKEAIEAETIPCSK